MARVTPPARTLTASTCVWAMLLTGCGIPLSWSVSVPTPRPAASATAPVESPTPSAATDVPTATATPTPTTSAAGTTRDVLFQAHQGGGGLAIAGTAKQFRKAAATDVDMVELDTVITRDGVIVINHSDLIKDVVGRSCDHDGLRVHTVTYSRVKAVRCAGESLTTLHEVLDIFRPTKIRLNIEIKAWDNAFSQPDESLRRNARAIMKTLDEGGFEGRYILSFFDWRVLIPAVRAVHPDLYVIALERSSKMKQPGTRMFDAVSLAASMGANAFEPDLPFVQENLLDFITAKGMDPQVWYANTPEDVRFVLAHGVSPISTDDPVMARAVVADAGRGRLAAFPVTHHLRPRTVLAATLAAGGEARVQIFGSGRVPLDAQEKLAGVGLEISSASDRDVALAVRPRGGDSSTEQVVTLPAGGGATTVLASPGDLGQVELRSAERTKLRIRIVDYRTALYRVVPS